ncbi:uncharacterized protein EAE98_004115 [Botrytis deweyae]|uniref:C2H2-type domain-containing protein n=1 Tax=Botrytis deweyae TaxID=2478750 RepID=A0ABQ7ISQ9_9HELO|nr:uncharacterized protein EAE98_004115 [Botrytis deweyae]KAF7932816.1 hypothetical protein EAE98_004115 [Botrytis deweyae]
MTMGNPRLKNAFDGMNAPRLRELLNKLCECGKFTIDDAMGKIEVEVRNIVISNGFIDLTQSDDSDGEGERNKNGGVGNYNDNDELAKEEGDNGEVAFVDIANLSELEDMETNQQMVEQKIDEEAGLVKSADQQTNKDDEEAFEGKEGYSEEESEIDSWDSDDDNDVPALRKSEIKELLSSKKDYLEKMYAEKEKHLRVLVASKKRNLKIFECENCGSDFNIEENQKGYCSFHPGIRELDANYAEDYHWPNHGEPWKSLDDPEYADRFLWSCCDRYSDAEACIFTRHKALEERNSKRTKTEAY